MKKQISRLALARKTALTFALISLSTSAFSAGTSFDATSISGLGNAGAGQAAEAGDASVMFANPAALTRFTRAELTQGLAVVTIDTVYTSGMNGDGADTGTSNPEGSMGQQFTRKDGYDAGAFAPNTYVAIPLSQKTVMGISASGSHGLVLHYDNNFPGRNQGRDIDFKVIRLNLGVGHKVTDTLSLGINASYERFYQKVGLNINYADAVGELLNSQGGNNPLTGLIGGAVGSLIAPGEEAAAELRVLGWAVNGQLGALWEPSSNTRIGISYRPETKFTNNKGKLTIRENDEQRQFRESLSGIPGLGESAGDLNPEQRVKQDITLNDEFRFSVFHHATPKLDLMATYTRQDFTVTKLEYFREANGRLVQAPPQNFKVGESYRIGMNYRLYKRLTLRAGFATENGVIDDATRLTILPDSDRKYYALGASLDLNKDMTLHVAYQYLDTDPAPVGLNEQNPPDGSGGPPGINPQEVNGGDFQGVTQLDTHFFGIGLTDRF